MLKKTWVTLFLLLTFCAFSHNTPAQAKQETEPAERSELAATDLPTAGERILEDSVPDEMKTTLAKLVASGGEDIRQGGSEVLTWTGNGYKKSTSVQLMKKIEASLQNSGWTYEVGETNKEFVLFTLFRREPKRRALIGFFVPSDDGLVLALTEMLRADAPTTAEANNGSGEEPAVESKSEGVAATSSFTRDLFGKWAWASTGSTIRDYTGKTIAGNASRFTYEFFPNGTVEYVGIMHTASLAGCRLEAFTTKKGKVSIDGNTMTIAWAPASFSRADTCTPEKNYKKTLPAETEVQTWQIKNDNGRTLLCLNSKDGETCFDRAAR